jgi:16S rRNA (cytosine967-C5)-methyltransferase
MLYATCSVFEEENAGQVEAFIGRHADARRLPTLVSSMVSTRAATTGTTTRATDNDAQLHHLPDAEHDGFYYSLLQKD